MITDRIVTSSVFSLAIDRVPQNTSNSVPAGQIAFGGLVSASYYYSPFTSAGIEVTKLYVSYGITYLSFYFITHELLYGLKNGTLASSDIYQSIIDNGTSGNFVPSPAAANINTQFSLPGIYNETLGYWIVDCEAVAPFAAFKIGGRVMPMDEMDMIVRSLNGLPGFEDVCFSVFADGGSVGEELFIIGAVWLRNYVVAFDVGRNIYNKESNNNENYSSQVKKMVTHCEHCNRPLQYCYKGLPSAESDTKFRIMELLPGNEQDPISYHLHEQDWNDPLEYEAISYAWGDTTIMLPSVCEGHLLQITLNLVHGLRKLRDAKTSRFIWADAICIDQGDNLEERSHQVNNMRQIYNKAIRVLVWLGPDDSDKAQTAALVINSIAESCLGDDAMLPSKLNSMPKLGKIAQRGVHWSHLTCNSPYNWHCLLWFFSHTWYNRLWVFQEVNAGPPVSVICGNTVLDWQLVALAAEYVAASRDLFHTFEFWRSNVWQAVTLREGAMYHRSHLDLLHNTRAMLVSNPKDKIYALLGMPPFLPGGFPMRADYRKNLEDIYGELADLSLEYMGNVNLLSYVQHEGPVPENRPSWVPLWHLPKISHLLPVFLAEERNVRPARNASKGFSPSLYGPLREKDSSVLRIPGIAFDVVTSETQINNEEWFHADNYTKINHPVLAFFKKQMEEPTAYPNGEQNLDVYGMALTFGLGASITRDGEELRFSYENFYAYIVHLYEVVEQSPPDSLRKAAKGGDWQKYESKARDVCWNRSFFITEHKYMGVGPQCLRVGDRVCVLADGSVPFVLKGVGYGEREWRLVGECYLHGIMDGEAIENNNRKEKMFIIK